MLLQPDVCSALGKGARAKLWRRRFVAWANGRRRYLATLLRQLRSMGRQNFAHFQHRSGVCSGCSVTHPGALVCLSAMMAILAPRDASACDPEVLGYRGVLPAPGSTLRAGEVVIARYGSDGRVPSAALTLPSVDGTGWFEVEAYGNLAVVKTSTASASPFEVSFPRSLDGAVQDAPFITAYRMDSSPLLLGPILPVTADVIPSEGGDCAREGYGVQIRISESDARIRGFLLRKGDTIVGGSLADAPSIFVRDETTMNACFTLQAIRIDGEFEGGREVCGESGCSCSTAHQPVRGPTGLPAREVALLLGLTIGFVRARRRVGSTIGPSVVRGHVRD